MASLRDTVKDYQDELRDGIAWVAFWKQGRSWNAEYFHLDMDDTLYPEKALVPYPVIVAATKGDPDAMKIVLQHFSGYIARLSMRKLYDERGNVYFGVDHDIRERLQAKLMMAVLTFKAEE